MVRRFLKNPDKCKKNIPNLNNHPMDLCRGMIFLAFYCWGHVVVVLLSTLFFRVAGIENWKYMALLWALIPILNGIVFIIDPVPSLVEDGKRDFP